LKHDNYAKHPFQSLLFLIRDWDYEQQFELGFKGGEKYLAEHVFKIKRGHAAEMKELRKVIKDSYESIECFLMPHPGQTVAGTKDYDGHWSAIDSRFIEQLKKLVPSILAPENLVVKKIAREEVTGDSLYWNMQFYLQLFVSELLPSPKSIYEATVDKFLQEMISRYNKEYKELISKGSAAVITHTDFNILHLDSKKKVIDSYDAERKMGKKSSIIYYRNKLINRIENFLVNENQTMYFVIENKMRGREIEAQKNETLRQKILIEDLKRKYEEAAKRNEEAHTQLLKNVEKLNRQNEKIQNITDTMNQQKDQIKKEREEQRARVKALAEDFEKRLKDQEEKYRKVKAALAQIGIPKKAYLKQGNCYLCAQDSLVDSEKRKTKCCDTGSLNTVWLIRKSSTTHISWNGTTYNVSGSYTIKNVEYGRYLYDSIVPYDESLIIRQDRLFIPPLGYWKITRLINGGFHIQSPRGKYISGCYTKDADKPIRWEIIAE
jgi:hypothetical protein